METGATSSGQASRADAVSSRLERLILDGTLGPGDRLPPERELAGSLGVSRGSVREALRDLEVRGLIDRTRGRGTTVLRPGGTLTGLALAGGLDANQIELAQVMDVRACIEPSVAGRAARNATAQGVAQLEALLVEMEAESRPAHFARLDRTFHRAIAQYSNNPLLVRLHDRVQELTEPSRREHLLTADRMRSSRREHERIAAAIRAGDEAGAVAAAAAHVASVQRRVSGP
ncbi:MULTISPECIES: FadR/GntR family transcriptional regulator [unclassified Modestobacter]|uniref:FadR/GntR family transcriptional regulator n=1 Tax=unclassified Modestobacter TaxID=2643866 RepID=UPI0022AAF96B|nr:MULTISPECIES: FadR/GntR family transcriptional regulator [unclassified Modestobacter]MCZ2826906.1 FadR/GntR family transcriptional regulator [Modestobacter sp. VKM Ac-2981]MCZ2855398.1 FadR/GntR family transcriptional regulator [Modestobacter sp. VKM Ac-2982]